MGIQGLLPLLKSIMVPIHIKELKGSSVAVDTYSWLHKGALSCSKDLCKGIPTSKHIDYCMHRVNLLRHFGVNPILVFDGGILPMKGEQENKRARSRKENLARAIEHESCGNASAAYECYQKAVDISPAIAFELIQVLKQENISYIVAPYEADAQMTYLVDSKQVDAVITEDSDLIPFGCSRIIYKMDKFGQGVEFQYSMLPRNKELCFTGFTKQMILEMCILSGCDYLQSLPGMGLKKAHALIKKFKSYDKVIRHLKYSSIVVSPLYEECFRKAIMTFQHQRVYDPVMEDIVHLSNPPNNIDEDLNFLGPLIPQHIAKGIAKGDIDPFTQLPIQMDSVGARRCPDGVGMKLKIFKHGGETKRANLPAQKNLLTNYFCLTSLEAKRNFRAPRTSPSHPTIETPHPQEDVRKEADYCVINCDVSSISDIASSHITIRAEDLGANAIQKGPSVLLESQSHYEMGIPQQSRHLINPCMALQKEREYSALDAAEGKTRIEKKNIIVRSSYFKHKSTNVTEQESEAENPLHKDITSGAKCLNDVPYCERTSCLEVDDETTRTENSDIKSFSLQHEHMTNDPEIRNAMHLVNNLSVTAMNEINISQCESISASDADEGKLKINNRKRALSQYFKNRNLTANDQEIMPESLLLKDVEVDTCEDTIKGSSAGCNEGSIRKRKSPDVGSAHEENLNHKHMRTSRSLSIEGSYTSDPGDPSTEMRYGEEKFGCNISHLSKYSDIAEKSMEKFVAVISSFRCSSSGSRASGLRAPLKDIRNTCTNRSSNSTDLSKFEYAPSKRKAPLASHKC